MRRCVILIVCAVVATVIGVSRVCESIESSATISDAPITVIIDPGHGGEDGGTTGVNEALEKDINLEISLTLAALFEDAGYNVILTRDGDYSLGDLSLSKISARKASDIKRRVEICNSSKAAAVISVHQNFFEQEKYSGAQVFYGTDPESEALAEEIQLRLREDIQPENDRKIKPGGESIYLLKNVQVPAVIVECGFLSNAQEAAKLSDKSYQDKIAYGIYLGATEYLSG